VRAFTFGIDVNSGHTARRLRRLGQLQLQLLCEPVHYTGLLCRVRAHRSVCPRQRRRRRSHETPRGQPRAQNYAINFFTNNFTEQFSCGRALRRVN